MPSNGKFGGHKYYKQLRYNGFTLSRDLARPREHSFK